MSRSPQSCQRIASAKKDRQTLDVRTTRQSIDDRKETLTLVPWHGVETKS